MSIGARSQSARTYLEKSIDELGDCDLESLVAHGLRALKGQINYSELAGFTSEQIPAS